MSKTDDVGAARQSQAQVLLEHVSQGVSTATELVKAMGLSKSRVSHLAAKLLKERRLIKRGQIYLLPGKRKLIAGSAPQNPGQAALVKDPRAIPQPTPEQSKLKSVTSKSQISSGIQLVDKSALSNATERKRRQR